MRYRKQYIEMVIWSAFIKCFVFFLFLRVSVFAVRIICSEYYAYGQSPKTIIHIISGVVVVVG